MAGMNRNPFMPQMQGQAMQQNVNGHPAQVRQFSNLGVMNNIRQPQQVVQRPVLPQQNFGNAALNQHAAQLLNNNPAMLQQQLQSNNPNHSVFSRQLALLGHAQQQLPQNGPLNPAAAFSQQQQNSQMNGHMGADQAHGAADGQPTQRLSGPQQMQEQVSGFMMDKEGQRRLTQDEVNYKLTLFNRELESEKHKLENMRANPAEAHAVPALMNRITAKNMFLQHLNQRIANEFPSLAMGGQRLVRFLFL